MKTVLIGMATGFVKPSTIIAIAGPVILAVNRDHLAVASGNTQRLAALLSDVWVYALIEWNVQIYTLTLAWVFLQFEALMWLFICLRGALTSANSQDLHGLLHHLSISQLILVVVLITQLLFTLFYFLLSGALATPEILELYVPPGGSVPGKIHPPPYTSIITWARVLVVILGIWVAIRTRIDNLKQSTKCGDVS
jgi:hypothetical protein